MHTLCARGTMKPEITAAVGFLSRFLRIKGHVNDRQLQTFSASLQDILSGKTMVHVVLVHNVHYFKCMTSLGRVCVKNNVIFQTICSALITF
uniref:BTG1 n=1 Tax=Esox lucius TaxID=8010 RepID=C1BZB4_ESOLU|nr:BTG1 [Esox lucius]